MKKSPEISKEITVASSDNQVVILNAKQVKAIKIKAGKIEKRSISGVIKANGFLDVPPQNKAVISPMITGYMRKVNFLVGDNVRKGQVVAELESMEYIDLQQQYMQLMSKIKYLKEDFERQKLLREEDAVSRKKYVMAEMEYKSAVSEFNGLNSKLEMLNVDKDRLEKGLIAPNLLVRAPISGSVKKLNTMIGKHIDPSEEIMEIVNPEHLHLELSVFEKDVLKVKKDQKVWFQIPNVDNQRFEGLVFLVGKDLSEEKRSINVHVHINEDQTQFAVGMYATATIITTENTLYTLPVSAIVNDGNKEFIFRQQTLNEHELSYERIPIITGQESDGLVEIAYLNDIGPDDEIVIEGAFYLLNAFSSEGLSN